MSKTVTFECDGVGCSNKESSNHYLPSGWVEFKTRKYLSAHDDFYALEMHFCNECKKKL